MEKQSFIKRNQFVFIAIALFIGICVAYFSPILEGKKISQSDVELINGVQQEATKYYNETGNYTLWTNSMFGGMPTYQVWLGYPNNVAGYIMDTYIRTIPNPINTVFLYLIGFFILLRTLKMNVWLSILGSIAFAFSSYNFIIITAGHTNKAIVIGLLAPTLAGVLMAYRGKVIQGAALFALFLALQLKANHFQMTYYFGLGIIIYGLFMLVDAIKTKTFLPFLKTSLAIIAAAIIAVGVNITPLWLTQEYADETIRGKSELNLNPEGNKNGLTKEYAFEYSYGIQESLSFLIPNINGGASAGELSKTSETYKFLQKQGVPNAAQVVKRLPLYWGEQSFTAGPVYFGAIIFFLFIFGLFIVKGKDKWWILATVLLTIALSWGRHFMGLSGFFFDNFPLYNKFRAVSSILVVTSLLFPLLACLAIQELIEGKIEQIKINKALRNSLIITGGITLLFALLPGLAGEFSNAEMDKRVFGDAYDQIINALAEDRKSLLQADAFRSLIFILFSAALIIVYIRKKIKSQQLILGLLLLVLIDMWTINKRYLNDENFSKRKSKVQEMPMTAVDVEILKDKDLYYRVYNTTQSITADASTSYYHKSLGGYHAAKLKRYQELIDFQLSKGNMSAYNMLNTKYFIVNNPQTQQQSYQLNPEACGNAWFIKEIKFVPSADSEMNSLSNFNPKNTVVVDERYKSEIGDFNPIFDSVASIKLTKYNPMQLDFESNASTEQFAVFSDIYYSKGWNVYIDGVKGNYIRANYLLRAMKVPAGKHQIVFKFEPEAYFVGEKIALASSLLLVLLVGLGAYKTYKSREE
jgi:Bacterial membrane protein YfhO